MRAACLVRPSAFSLSQLPRPTVRAGEVRLEVTGCGVCASNLPLWQGRPWFSYPCAAGFPGHENWGYVDAVGEGVDGIPLGAPAAALSIHSFAEFDCAPAQSVRILPQQLAGQAFPGEALACAMSVYQRAQISPASRVVVVGVGFIGALLIQLARSAGAQVIAIARRPFARAVARDCGADAIFPLTSSAAETLRLVDGAAAFDRVIESSGLQLTLDVASGLAAPGAKLIIAGYHQDGARTIDLCDWNWKGIDIVNAHERDPRVCAEALTKAIEYVSQGIMDYQRLLTHAFSLDQLNDAFTLLASRPDGFLKGYIRLDHD